jgi:hypothetical protein
MASFLMIPLITAIALDFHCHGAVGIDPQTLASYDHEGSPAASLATRLERLSQDDPKSSPNATGPTGTAMNTTYGRTDEEWDALAAAGRSFLEHQARLERDTTYTDMNFELARRTGLRPFDFDREDERAAMGRLLGMIVEETFPVIGCMISALVLYYNDNTPGSGFFALAQRLGLLAPGASDDEKLALWSDQVNAVHAVFRRPRRAR